MLAIEANNGKSGKWQVQQSEQKEEWLSTITQMAKPLYGPEKILPNFYRLIAKMLMGAIYIGIGN